MLCVSEGLGGGEEGKAGVGGCEAGVDCAQTFGPFDDGGEMQGGGGPMETVKVAGRLKEDGRWGRRRRGGHGVGERGGWGRSWALGCEGDEHEARVSLRSPEARGSALLLTSVACVPQVGLEGNGGR